MSHECISFVSRDGGSAECLSKADCAQKMDAPFCDPDARSCVACLVNADCQAQMVCNASKECVAATPTGCTGDADCPGGICVNHACVPNAPDAGPPDAGDDAGPPDAGPADAGHDAGPPDAGYDAGPPDAGPPDAGPPDGGTPDAGPPDAGPPDAGIPDAGLDAGPPDAGPPDAGPPDAGPPDAGTPDAGVHVGPYCTSSSDCSRPTPFCLTSTQTCVGCINDSNCPGSSDTCSNSYQCGRSGSCSSNRDCTSRPGRPICDGYSLCGMGCLQDADCTSAMTPRCWTAGQQCVVCLTSADCDGRACSGTTHTCAP